MLSSGYGHHARSCGTLHEYKHPAESVSSDTKEIFRAGGGTNMCTTRGYSHGSHDEMAPVRARCFEATIGRLDCRRHVPRSDQERVRSAAGSALQRGCRCLRVARRPDALAHAREACEKQRVRGISIEHVESRVRDPRAKVAAGESNNTGLDELRTHVRAGRRGEPRGRACRTCNTRST